jgi:hypothetical protein
MGEIWWEKFETASEAFVALELCPAKFDPLACKWQARAFSFCFAGRMTICNKIIVYRCRSDVEAIDYSSQ